MDWKHQYSGVLLPFYGLFLIDLTTTGIRCTLKKHDITIGTSIDKLLQSSNSG